MEIDELQAGPELDQFIAEHVMGWKLTDQAVATWQELYNQANKAVVSNTEIPGSRLYDNGRRVDEFKPSTDIAAAWEAWTELIAADPYAWAIYPTTGCQVYIEFYGHTYMGVRECGCGDWSIEGTLPLAICRAAYKYSMEAHP